MREYQLVVPADCVAAADNRLKKHASFASKVGLFDDFWGKPHFCPKNHFDLFLTNL